MNERATKITFANENLLVTNSVEEPLKIQRQTTQVNYKGKAIKDTFPPYSFTVVKMQMK